jgi:hypothetical protein
MADHLPSRRFLIWIELERGEELAQDLGMGFGLLEILVSFLCEFRIDSALQGGLIHVDAAQFRFQRLIQQLVDLRLMHRLSFASVLLLDVLPLR